MNKKTANRIKSLLPNGLPRYVRCYDNGGKTFDRFTVVFSGNYRSIPNRRCRAKNGPLDFQNVGMSESPFHPQGFGQHGEKQSSGQAHSVLVPAQRLPKAGNAGLP